MARRKAVFFFLALLVVVLLIGNFAIAPKSKLPYETTEMQIKLPNHGHSPNNGEVLRSANALRRMVGQIGYTLPPDMSVGVPVTLEARISRNAAKTLRDEISVPGTVQSQKIEVGRAMRMHLTGGESFSIRSLDDAATAGKPKALSDDHDAVWNWDVTALQSGRHLLFMEAEIVETDSKGAEAKDTVYQGVRVYAREIPVRVNPLYNLLHWNWQEIFKTLGGMATVTAVGAWWQKRRSGKTEDESKPEPVAAGTSND